MTMQQWRVLAVMMVVLVLGVFVPTHLCRGDDGGSRESSSDGEVVAWTLRDHEANHTDNSTDHDHDHDHDHGNGTDPHHHEEEAMKEIFLMFDADNDTLLSEEELEVLHATLFPDFEHEHEHEHDHDHGNSTEPDDDHDHEAHDARFSDGEEDHDHAHNKRYRIGAMNKRKTAAAMRHTIASTRSARKRAAAMGWVGGADIGGNPDAALEGSVRSKRELTEEEFELYCLTPEALFADYDGDADGFLSEEEFAVMTPALLLMVLKGCDEHLHHDEETCEPPDAWRSWLAGLGSVALICLIALIGIALIPFTISQKRPLLREIHSLVVMLMISFAVGALIGDAVLHLMPEVLEVHSHSGGGHDEHAHEEEETEEDHDDKSYLEPLALVLAGVFFFFFIEKVLLFILGKEIQHGHGMQHGHNSNSSEDELEMEEGKGTKDKDAEKSDEIDDDVMIETGFQARLRRFGTNQVDLMKTVKTYGWLNLISDVFHNFVDGLAIGSAYSQSLNMGLSTSVAVAFHEIPQELGDYGVLIKAGFTKPYALFFNFVTACTAFLGVIIGLGVGRAVTDANKWILGFTAGGFFYIALADLLPELNSHPRKGWWGLLDIAIQFFGVLLGFGIMAIIAATESEHDC